MPPPPPALPAGPSGVLPTRPPERPFLEVGEVMAKAASENFPVASRLLPRREREHLLAVYGYARFVDDLGDLADGDRLAQLAWAEDELDRALEGRAAHPVFARAGAMARACGADRRLFADLIAANRQDQLVSRYASYDELAAYCALSANPVGRLVLAAFGRRGSRLAAWSDSICTGLQLVEHWQDVAEDYAAGRVYLPGDDLDHFGVEEGELAARPPGAAGPSQAFRRLMAFEVARARALLLAGRPLVRALGGSQRLAVAGFLGGGLAQLAAIERAGYDVCGERVKATKAAVARAAAGEVMTAR